MRLEGTRRCPAIDGLKNRSFYLQISSLVRIVAHCLNHYRPFYKNISHLSINNQIDITLTIPQFYIEKSFVSCHLSLIIIHLLAFRQWTYRFSEKNKLFSVNRCFSCSGFKNKPADSCKITNIHQFLKDRIVHLHTDIISANVHLNRTAGILKIEKRSLPHDSSCHDTPCHTDSGRILLLPGIINEQ